MNSSEQRAIWRAKQNKWRDAQKAKGLNPDKMPGRVTKRNPQAAPPRTIPLSGTYVPDWFRSWRYGQDTAFALPSAGWPT